MTDLSTLVQQGQTWWLIPSAIALGALHGLEPGHSKTMMAAFIVAVRGTVAQALALGLSATVSHTAVVWAVALAGLTLGDGLRAEAVEPWLHLVSGVLILAVAAWMAWRTRSHMAGHHHHDHDHDHDHDHAHMDAHARAHARDIEQNYAGRQVSMGQVIVFGLTGGLIPCPASITVLLVCLQLEQVALGATLVLAFSVGLALVLMASGALAAFSVRQVSARWSGLGRWTERAPYLSAALMALIGGWMAWHGLQLLQARGAW
jgi:nickel/cobalt transporter (NicO) family protein